VHIVKENAEALVVAGKEVGLELNADKTKYMVMSRDQNVGRSHSIKTNNDFFEMVEDSKYLGTTLANLDIWQAVHPSIIPLLIPT
jgi:hypothetical protein